MGEDMAVWSAPLATDGRDGLYVSGGEEES